MACLTSQLVHNRPCGEVASAGRERVGVSYLTQTQFRARAICAKLFTGFPIGIMGRLMLRFLAARLRKAL